MMSPCACGRGPKICSLSPTPLQVVAEDPTEAYTTVQFHPDGLILGTGEGGEGGGPVIKAAYKVRG